MSDAIGPPRRKRLSWESRCEIVAKVRSRGMSPQQAAANSGVHRSTVYRLLARFDSGGWAALHSRRPVPHRQPRRLPRELEEQVVNARAASHYGPARLGAILGMPASTVGKVLRRAGLSRRPRPPRPQIVRYERERPGELLHVDTKRLGRFHQIGKRILADGIQRSPRAGWHTLHVAVDDHTRIAYCEVLEGQGAEASCAFLERAVAWFNTEHAIQVERVLSDNGHAYRSHAWRDTCAALGIERRYTRPYTPRTNGKAESFIGTALREWAYRYPYPTSTHRTRALPGWVRWYNRRRPHSSLGGLPPISRVAQVRGYFT
ncbi:MAG TPA: IS481 family transposase [Miltoncostaeaceae bacterium]|nr:IS481 family transposase [Miltoncostaeaceae bacterium]